MKTKSITGTCYFPTIGDAIDYYSYEGGDIKRAVEMKINEGLIHIGKPPLKPNQRAVLNIKENRYFIAQNKGRINKSTI